MDPEVKEYLDTIKGAAGDGNELMIALGVAIFLILVLAVFASYVVKYLKDENAALKVEIVKIRERERVGTKEMMKEMMESVKVLELLLPALDNVVNLLRHRGGSHE